MTFEGHHTASIFSWPYLQLGIHSPTQNHKAWWEKPATIHIKHMSFRYFSELSIGSLPDLYASISARRHTKASSAGNVQPCFTLCMNSGKSSIWCQKLWRYIFLWTWNMNAFLTYFIYNKSFRSCNLWDAIKAIPWQVRLPYKVGFPGGWQLSQASPSSFLRAWAQSLWILKGAAILTRLHQPTPSALFSIWPILEI